MTAEPTPDLPVLVTVTPTHHEQQAFLAEVADDGTLLKVLVPPKKWFLKYGRIASDEAAMQEAVQAGLDPVQMFIDKCLDTKSGTYVQGRLDNDDDDFDVDDLNPIIEALQKFVIPNRPTMPPNGSGRRSPRSGTNSTVRARGKGSTRTP